MSENMSLISSALVPVEDIESEFTLYSIERRNYINFWKGKNRYFLINQLYLFKNSGFCVLDNDYLYYRSDIRPCEVSIVSFIKSLIPKYIPERYMPKQFIERYFLIEYRLHTSSGFLYYHNVSTTERRMKSFIRKLESDGYEYVNFKPIEVSIFTFKKSIISLLEQLSYEEIQKDVRWFYCKDDLVKILKEHTKKVGIPFDVYINSWAKRLIKDAESGNIVLR